MSLEDKTGKVCVIVYKGWTLRPSGQSQHNYSSGKLELLALKWAVTEKFRDYLLGSKFTVYTNNNPLAYIQTSKLCASKICWLSELALFDFNIQYRSGKTNKPADTLSQQPVNLNLEIESNSDNNIDNPVELWYATICDIIKLCLKDSQIPYDLKKEMQAISNALEGEVGLNVPQLCEVPDLAVQTSVVSVFNQVSLATMA